MDEDNLVDIEEEQPTVVVLNPGDLTAEEAAKAEKDLQKGQCTCFQCDSNLIFLNFQKLTAKQLY